MPNDNGRFDPELRIAGDSVYRNPKSLLPMQRLTTAHFAEHLPALFPGLRTDGWEQLRPTATPEELGHLQSDVDMVALFPTPRALRRLAGKDDPRHIGNFADELDQAVYKMMRRVIPRVDIHYFDGHSGYVRRNKHTQAAMEAVNGAYAESDVYPMPIQMGHRWDGYTPSYAEAFFEKDRLCEFGLDATQPSVVFAVHQRVYGYVPLMSVHCPGSLADPDGMGMHFTDTMRLDGIQGRRVACCWNWGDKRPRAGIGDATGFVRRYAIMP